MTALPDTLPAAPARARTRASPRLAASGPSTGARLASLDVFRGLTIAAMLVVNHPGDWKHRYAAVQHAAWHGWTPADLIFPWFLFIVGVSLTLSVRSQLDRGLRHADILARAARRAVILVALGLVLASFPWLSGEVGALRIPGVLQRIALAFIVATPIVLWLRTRWQTGVMVALLLGYWAAMSRVPVPGSAPGVWDPGLDLGAHIDRAVFGSSHLLHGSWDPEGLLSTLPALATLLAGALAGRWLQTGAGARVKGTRLFGAGVAAAALGLAWGTTFPINKNLWTSSYAVFTLGTALMLLGFLYWVVDVRGHRRWTPPFVLLGINAILVYVLAILTDLVLHAVRVGAGGRSVWTAGYQVLFASWLPPLSASFAFALAYLLGWTGVVWVLSRRGIRVRVS